MTNDSLFAMMRRHLGLSAQKAVYAASDLLAVLGTALVMFLLRTAIGPLDPVLYNQVLPLLLLTPLIGVIQGLYQRLPMPPHQEMRRQFMLVTLVYAIILLALFLAKTGDLYSRAVLAGSWLCTLFALPQLRGWCRRRFCHKRWWAEPVVILGNGPAARQAWHTIRRHSERGLRPVAITALPDDDAQADAQLARLASRWPEGLALVALDDDGQAAATKVVTMAGRHFGKVLIVPHAQGNLRQHWLESCDFGNGFALLLRHNLHDHWRIVVKRSLEYLLCLLCLPLLLPLGLVLALCVKLDSKGPVLYRQERIGKGGRAFRVCKFRTMRPDADSHLHTCLERDEQMRAEWERDHKLKNDPRITRMGRFLRKTSLDELPQLLNVFRGEMSLVGPRPIVQAEIAKYGDVFDEYCRVRPGITGLWQVSGRNDTTYAQRVAFDHYYINNWSIWLDVWIMVRTVPVMLTGNGAY